MVATKEDKNAASVFRDPGPGECGRMNGRHREGAVEDQQEKLKRHSKSHQKISNVRKFHEHFKCLTLQNYFS